MSSKRPTQVPRWASGDTAVIVQPPTLRAQRGFLVGTRPPAPWINFQFNALGAWVDFLRSPNVEHWTHTSWSNPYDASSPVLLAVDAKTTDAVGAAYRYVIAGWETGPTTTLRVSQAGNAWDRRTNVPGGMTRPTALAHLDCAARWVIADDTPAFWYAPHDAGGGTSPVGGTSTGWLSASGTGDDGSGALTAVKAFASNAYKALAITSAGGLYSADGVTWFAITESTPRSGNGLDAVWTGEAFVYVTSEGEVYASPTADGAFALKTTLSAGAGDWRLAVGDVGEVLAYQKGSGSVLDLFRSTNSGNSFTALTPIAPDGADGATRAVVRLSCVRGHDGVWMATSTVAPFLWTSSDAVNWLPLRPQVSGAGALAAIAWNGHAWIAAGNGFVVQCPPGADPAAGDYVASTTPATLADAGTLRGRRITTGAPNDGDTLIWDAGTEQWTYGPGGGGSSSVASTDITDSTATGRSVLTATDAATARTALGAAAAAGAVSLDAANVFTDLQTLSKSSGTWGAPIPVVAFRHNNGGGSSWQGVAVRFEVKNDGSPAIPYGYVVARAHGCGGDANDNFVEMRPAHSAGAPPVGLRVRCNVASAIWGAELLLAANGGSPTFQPCRESGSGDVDLTLQGLGAGVVRLPAATGFVGTVLEILALTRPAGVMAFATNASGGPKPCWSTGAAWVLADGSALS